jgi:hypothetical protein
MSHPFITLTSLKIQNGNLDFDLKMNTVVLHPIYMLIRQVPDLIQALAHFPNIISWEMRVSSVIYAVSGTHEGNRLKGDD